MPTRSEIAEILNVLARTYPDAKCALVHSSPFELLVATMLSAQCTDKLVNKVTAKMFPKYNKPEQFAALTPEQLEEEIKECGLYKTKAKNIIAASRLILERHGGQVPRSREELMALPGVGRKTANVVLSNAFGVPAIAVDTHVQRVSNRIGLAKSTDPLKTEQQLMKRIPREKWSDAHHWLIHHGRQICLARAPRCTICPLEPWCAYRKQQRKGRKGTARNEDPAPVR
jgi:endonuclease-3